MVHSWKKKKKTQLNFYFLKLLNLSQLKKEKKIIIH
jgi:hypothetical protein